MPNHCFLSGLHHRFMGWGNQHSVSLYYCRKQSHYQTNHHPPKFFHLINNTSLSDRLSINYFFLSSLSRPNPLTPKYTTVAITIKSIKTLKKSPYITLAGPT